MISKRSKKRMSGLMWAGMGILGLIYALFNSGHSDDYIRNRIVKIEGNGAMCSGEQVRAPSGQDYILTAGHCKGLMVNGAFSITTEDGKVLQRKFIEEDANADLMLIEGLPNLKGLALASYSYQREHVRTFTRGGRQSTYITEGVLIEVRKIQIYGAIPDASCNQPKYTPDGECTLDVWEQSATATIRAGSSGGALVDSSGNLVGVASAGSEIDFMFVTHLDIVRFLKSY